MLVGAPEKLAHIEEKTADCDSSPWKLMGGWLRDSPLGRTYFLFTQGKLSCARRGVHMLWSIPVKSS